MSGSLKAAFFFMINAVIGQKRNQMQGFLENGIRVPLTEVLVDINPVIAIKTMDKDGYSAIQVGFGSKKKANKAQMGQIRGAKLEKAPRFLREVHSVDAEMPEIGTLVKPSDVLKPGDIIDVSGVSKGKGYAGVVKRHGFRGGPRTHGQSDRERAPGSIGQTTTPGRVYKGKRMAGHMGVDTVTVQNLLVVAVEGDHILIKGLVPGSVNTILTIKKAGEAKKFVPLYKEAGEVVAEETPVEVVEEADVEIKKEAQPEVEKETQGTEETKVEVEKAETVAVDSSQSTVSDVKEGEAK